MGILSGLNAAETLSQTIFGSSGQQYNDSTRIPMTFTSTRRLQQLDSSIKSISSLVSDRQLNIFANGAVGQEQAELSMIEMMVNPNSIAWKQPKRIVKRDTQEGSVFFHFTNSKGQNNDILTLDFRGNTGNIDPRGDVSSSSSAVSTQSGINTGAIKKAIIWHSLWALTREPMLLPGNIRNEFLIVYSSPIIAIEMMLFGFFSNVLDWADTADKPFSKDYSFSFTVEKTIPDLDDIAKEYQSIGFNPDGTERTSAR